MIDICKKALFVKKISLYERYFCRSIILYTATDGSVLNKLYILFINWNFHEYNYINEIRNESGNVYRSYKRA